MNESVSFKILKINNSKEVAVDGKWSDPGAKLYDQLLKAGYFPTDDVNNPDNLGWDHYLKEAYLVAPIKNIKNSPYGITPYSKSGCKYPHHVVKGDELVVHIRGLQAAYSRAKQMGVFKGEIKEHLERHYKELELESNMNIEEKIDENFKLIESYLEKYKLSEDQSNFKNNNLEESKKHIEFDISGNTEEIENLIKEISTIAHGGHSFDVVIDPDDDRYNIKHFVDGDGSDRISKLKITEIDESSKNVYERSFLIEEKEFVGKTNLILERFYISLDPLMICIKENVDNGYKYRCRVKKYKESYQQVNDSYLSEEEFNKKIINSIAHDKLTVKNRSDGTAVLKREYDDGYIFYYTEFESEENEFNIPSWVGKEITGIKKYKGYQMALDHSSVEINKKIFLKESSFEKYIREIRKEDVEEKYFIDWIKEVDIGNGVKGSLYQLEGDSLFKKFSGEYRPQIMNYKCYGYFNNDKLDGIIMCIKDPKDNNITWLAHLFINPKKQGQGIGTKLVDHSLKKFPNKTYMLNVHIKNTRGIKLYKKFGFKIIKEYIDGKPPMRGYLMKYSNSNKESNAIESRELNNLFDKISTPEKLSIYMKSNFKYGYKGKDGKISTMNYNANESDKDFYDNYRLQSPDELILSKHGVCWDQAEFERLWFKKNWKKDFNVYHIRSYETEAQSTHTFLLFEDKGNVYWFENSWEKYRGIHQYVSINKALIDIKHKFIKYGELKNNDQCVIFTLSKPPKNHMSCQEYMDWAEGNKEYEDKQIKKNEKEDSEMTESYIFSEDDEYLHFNEWKHGKKNILFITGLIGSGKSTLGRN